VDTLKDERRSIARLYKTRFFNIHNVAWLITHRRLYAAMQAFKMTIGFKEGYALGLDMHGTDPTALMIHLQQKGTKYLPEDFGEWDGNVKASDIHDKYEVDNQFMTFHEEDNDNNIRREWSVWSVTDRIHIIEDTVYRVFQGEPSGRGCTSDTNSGVHDILNYANWIELMIAGGKPEDANCEAKDRETAEAVCGDDGGGTVSDAYAPIYNMFNRTKIFTHYGYNCTAPTKDGTTTAPYVDVQDFSFLKCTFRRDEFYYGIWHMEMAPKVIRELTNWVTINGDPHELFYDNLEDALRFAHGHGPNFYKQFQTEVNTVLKQNSQPQITTSYESLRSEFLAKFDKCE